MSGQILQQTGPVYARERNRAGFPGRCYRRRSVSIIVISLRSRRRGLYIVVLTDHRARTVWSGVPCVDYPRAGDSASCKSTVIRSQSISLTLSFTHARAHITMALLPTVRVLYTTRRSPTDTYPFEERRHIGPDEAFRVLHNDRSNADGVRPTGFHDDRPCLHI